MHAHIVENGEGNIVDVIYFCCDNCHRDYCTAHPDLPYTGWNGCQEGGDTVEFCAQCGVVAGGTTECECQRDNVAVHRVRSATGEKCKHGNYIQLPARTVERMG